MVRWGHGRMERWRCPACFRIRRKDYHAKVEIDEGAPRQKSSATRPYVSDHDMTLYQGDCLDVLRQLPDKSVDCCVTSPPYWGLRDYGIDGQLGLEATPDEFVAAMVAVFREVRRVLADHGTCWVNLGDSYATTPTGNRGTKSGLAGAGSSAYEETLDRYVEAKLNRPPIPDGLKPKDLVGIPWRVAFALQQPYYTGRIKDERDRIWLAAMVEAEGCMFIHRRKAGQPNGQGYERKADSFGAGLEVASTDRAIVERCLAIAGKGSIGEQTKGRNRTLYRWHLRSNECRDVVRELYPHMVAKHHEARLLIGCPSSGDKATAAWVSLKALHNGGTATIDFPAPETLYEPGWYVRSDVVWSKLNPMPESVTDRPTKSHEYVFLLTKRASYYFDQEAVRERAEWARWGDQTVPKYEGTDTATGWMKAETKEELQARAASGRNIRSVWSIATQPYPGAHFATFPEELARRCIVAGCPERVCRVCGKASERIVEREVQPEAYEPRKYDPDDPRFQTKRNLGGRYQAQLDANPLQTVGWSDCGHNAYRPGVVLDPFTGSGTSLFVARNNQRHSIGIELSEDYCKLTAGRLQQLSLLT